MDGAHDLDPTTSPNASSRYQSVLARAMRRARERQQRALLLQRVPEVGAEEEARCLLTLLWSCLLDLHC